MARRTRWTELYAVAAPLGGLAAGALARLHWWLGALLLAYLGSGVTVVQSDEVAVVLRNGRVVGGDSPQAVHPPGLLLALPRPFDEVVRVQTERIDELEIRELHFSRNEDRRTRYLATSRLTLDPELVGYLVTGDHNIVHAVLIARYKVTDPVAWALGVADSDAILRGAVMAGMVQSTGEMGVDAVLAEGRKALVERVTERAQGRLDAVQSGLEIVSLELTDLTPPQQVKADFSDVQSAYINAETAVKDANQYRETLLPRAQADRDDQIREAEAYAVERTTTAKAEAAAFIDLADEVRQDPGVVRERLYREGLEAVLKRAGSVRFVPPPTGAADRFRLQIPATRPASK